MTRYSFNGFTPVLKRDMLKMFAFDLEQEIPTIETEAVVRAVVHECARDTEIVEVSKREQRSKKGDMIIAAYVKEDLVAYLFAATNNTWIGEIDDWLCIGPREVYLYDAYTLPDYRGKGIYPFLICAATDYFRRRSYAQAIICSTARNQASIRGIERSGFQCYGIVTYRNIFGWRSWHHKVGERNVRTRLRNEN